MAVAAEEEPATAAYLFVDTCVFVVADVADTAAWARESPVGAKPLAPTKTATRARLRVFIDSSALLSSRYLINC